MTHIAAAMITGDMKFNDDFLVFVSDSCLTTSKLSYKAGMHKIYKINNKCSKRNFLFSFTGIVDEFHNILKKLQQSTDYIYSLEDVIEKFYVYSKNYERLEFEPLNVIAGGMNNLGNLDLQWFQAGKKGLTSYMSEKGFSINSESGKLLFNAEGRLYEETFKGSPFIFDGSGSIYSIPVANDDLFLHEHSSDLIDILTDLYLLGIEASKCRNVDDYLSFSFMDSSGNVFDLYNPSVEFDFFNIYDNFFYFGRKFPGEISFYTSFLRSLAYYGDIRGKYGSINSLDEPDIDGVVLDENISKAYQDELLKSRNVIQDGLEVLFDRNLGGRRDWTYDNNFLY